MTQVQRIARSMPPRATCCAVAADGQEQTAEIAKSNAIQINRRGAEKIRRNTDSMVKVNVQPDCGNAPKKLFIRDFMIAFANGEPSALLDCIANDVRWEMIGEQTLNSKPEVEGALGKILDTTIKEITLFSIITHGDEGAVNGTMKRANSKTYGFSHIFTFNSHGKNAKFKRIISYVIQEHTTD
jgi:hypothetical protein